MKASLAREVRYSDVDEGFHVTLCSLLELFQDLAASHSDRIGFGIRELTDQGIIWVLSKLGISIHRYPQYGEALRAYSWSRGADGFKMLRDFEIFCGDERIAAGSSVWFFVNVRDKRVQRVPAEIELAYQPEPIRAQEPGVAQWTPYQRFDPEKALLVQTRASDLDASGHVNNTRYCAYVLDTLAACYGERRMVKELKLQFSRGIAADARTVEVGLARQGDCVDFRLGSGRDYHARGTLLLAAASAAPLQPSPTPGAACVQD